MLKKQEKKKIKSLSCDQRIDEGRLAQPDAGLFFLLFQRLFQNLSKLCVSAECKFDEDLCHCVKPPNQEGQLSEEDLGLSVAKVALESQLRCSCKGMPVLRGLPPIMK